MPDPASHDAGHRRYSAPVAPPVAPTAWPGWPAPDGGGSRAGPGDARPLPGCAAPTPPGGITTILLVEDSRHAAEAVRLAARFLGLRLRRAEDLASARRHLRVYRPDLVLIDLGLPDGTGLELIAELALCQRRPRRCVAISADPDARAEALAAGAQAFVEKPLRLPGDLSVLLGSGSLPAAAAGAAIRLDPAGGPEAPPTDPAGGQDPLALRDDLLRARALLTGGDAGARRYATRFLAGLGRSLGDCGLQQAARSAGDTGTAGATEGLVAALDARVARAAWF